MKNIADLVETPEQYRVRTAELKAQAAAAREAADIARKTSLAVQAKADALTAALRQAEREERQAKTRAENEAHDNQMYEEIGQPLAGLNPAQHAIVYAQAWEQGHSGGYHEVENYYGEYAEMARKLLLAN